MPHLPNSPAPSNDDDSALDDLLAEYADRLQAGEPLDPESFARRSPAHAGQLRRLLPEIDRLHRVLPTDPGRTSGSAAASEAAGIHPGLPSGPGLGVLGDYRLLGELGRGGMGIVYEAEQISLGRRVALKVLPTAAAMDPRQLRRFQIEARAAAALHHTNIVPVHAVGSERGVPFYAMQLIAGRSLAEVIAELRRLDGRGPADRLDPDAVTARLTTGRLAPPEPGVDPAIPAVSGVSDEQAAGTSPSTGSSTRNRAYVRTAAGLGLQAAEALEHAHQQGVLHRDIKPANLLLDELGRLWITDFGLARLQEADAGLTATGDLLGTLRYMSPEQVMGRCVLIDGRTDIYSLGVTLYELLALRPAIEGEHRPEILRRIAEREPTPLRRLNPAVPADLETIVSKAIAKEASDRYVTAQQLADDLRRFLGCQPIQARRPSRLDRASKWARRHWPLVASVSALLVLVSAVLVAGLSWSNTRLQDLVEQLRREVARADLSEREVDRQRLLAERGRRTAERHLEVARLRQAEQLIASGQVERAQEILEQIRPRLDVDPPGFAWRYMWHLATRDVVQIRVDGRNFSIFALSPDGKSLATREYDGRIHLMDLDTGRVRADLTGRAMRASWPYYSPDGQSLLAVQTEGPAYDVERRRDLLVWDTASGLLRCRFPTRPEDGALSRPRFLDGETIGARWDDHRRGPMTLLLSLGRPGTSRGVPTTALRPWVAAHRRGFVTRDGDRLRIGDTTTGARRSELEGTFPTSVGPWAWTEDGRLVAAGVDDGLVVAWDVATGAQRHRLQIDADSVDELRFSPDDATLAVRDSQAGRIHLWDLASDSTRTLQVDEPARQERSLRMTFRPDSRRLAVSSWGHPGGAGPLTVWDIATGNAAAVCPVRPEGGATETAFTPDGRSLIFHGATTCLLWRLDPAEPIGLAGHKDEAWCVTFGPRSRRIYTSSDDTDEPETIKVWDAATGRLLAGWSGHPGTVSGLAVSPDGRVLASVALSAEQNVRLWDAETGRLLLEPAGHTDSVRAVAFSPDGRALATAGTDRVIRLWDPATGQPLAEYHGHTDTVRHLAFSPDGRTLASASNDLTVRLWDRTSGRQRALRRGPSEFASVAFSPDGSTLAAVNEAGSITLWGPRSEAEPRVIRGEPTELRCLAFHPDGRTLAASGAGRSVDLWDLLTGQQLLSLEGHAHQVNDLAFSPDGRTLASAGHGGAVKLWHNGPVDSASPARPELDGF